MKAPPKEDVTRDEWRFAARLEGAGFVMGDVTRLMRKGFDRKVRNLGLSRPQWRVLVYVLENEGLSQSELARRLELERAPLGQLVRALESLGFVSRARSPIDQREWIVKAGEKAQDILPQMLEAANWLRGVTFQGISRDEQSTLLRLLERMRSNLSFELDR
ncbi:MAG: MarR family transcriptional regulator [Pseudomonadota bacterium]